MKNVAIIAEKIEALKSLSDKRVLFLDDLELEFRPDLQKFITGETLSLYNGKITIGSNLFKKWLLKIKTKGFDDEIDFK